MQSLLIQIPKELLVNYIIPYLDYTDFNEFLRVLNNDEYLTENDYHTMINVKYPNVPIEFKNYEWSVYYKFLLNSTIIKLYKYNQYISDLPIIIGYSTTTYHVSGTPGGSSEPFEIPFITNLAQIDFFIRCKYPGYDIIYFGENCSSTDHCTWFTKTVEFFSIIEHNQPLVIISETNYPLYGKFYNINGLFVQTVNPIETTKLLASGHYIVFKNK